MAFSGMGQAEVVANIGATAAGEVTKLVNGVFNVSGSGYPKPAPPPLPYTVAQVTAMLQKDPTTFASLVKHIHGASPTDVRRVNGGTIPTTAELQSNVGLTATIGLALANAQGAPKGNISIGEANCRGVIQQGMLNYQTTGGQGGTVIPGTTIPLPTAKTASAAMPYVLGFGVLGAIAAMRFRRRR